MMESADYILLCAAMLCAALISFASTPIARVLAYRAGAIDIPRDARRMHHVPIPRMGGLAVFFAYVVTTAVFCTFTKTLGVIWLGGLLIVILGMFDDVHNLNAWFKLGVQILISLIPVSQGLVIDYINLAGKTISFGKLSYLITVLWIVGLTNAINLIDGLDGLCSGIAAICSLSMLLVTLTMDVSPTSVLLIGILAGSCLGFLPFNTNPAKIFLGDTGALFLGYVMAVLSVDGLFKFHAVVSFIIPISIFALPIFDTAFAFTRRIAQGRSPFSADRGHIHHRLIDMGFNQKQSVGILYAVSGILGISAILFTTERLWRAAIVILVGFGIFLADYLLVRNPKTRHRAGLGLPGDETENGESAAQAVNTEASAETEGKQDMTETIASEKEEHKNDAE